jgi:hypothetical protein
MQDYESSTKESEGGTRTEEDQQSSGKQKRTLTPNKLSTPSSPFESMPSMLAVDSFLNFLEVALAEALVANPVQDWWRNWSTVRTIMIFEVILRMTSENDLEESERLVDRVCPPADVHLRTSFWDDPRHSRVPQKQGQILSQLVTLPTRCLIRRLDLSGCSIRGAHVERLTGVLTQCTVLSHLNLSSNGLGSDGEDRLPGVLTQCPALLHLDIRFNVMGLGTRKPRVSWCGQTSGVLLG